MTGYQMSQPQKGYMGEVWTIGLFGSSWNITPQPPGHRGF